MCVRVCAGAWACVCVCVAFLSLSLSLALIDCLSPLHSALCDKTGSDALQLPAALCVGLGTDRQTDRDRTEVDLYQRLVVISYMFTVR